MRKPWIWVLMAVILLASIPWYLPPGSVGFIWLGLPAWMLVSLAFTLVMCGYLCWLCFTQWDVVEAEEEGRRSAGTEGAGSESVGE